MSYMKGKKRNCIIFTLIVGLLCLLGSDVLAGNMGNESLMEPEHIVNDTGISALSEEEASLQDLVKASHDYGEKLSDYDFDQDGIVDLYDLIKIAKEIQERMLLVERII